MLRKDKIYMDHLRVIQGIEFTQREADIIACLVHVKTDSVIAKMLCLSVRTVNKHVSNIISKINKPSRVYVMELVEADKKLKYIREYYACLMEKICFENTLRDVAKKIFTEKKKLTINRFDVPEELKKYFSLLKNDLMLANIELLYVDDHADLDIAKINTSDYYTCVFEILKKIDDTKETELMYKNLVGSLLHIKENNSFADVNYPSNCLPSSQQQRKKILWGIGSGILILTGLLYALMPSKEQESTPWKSPLAFEHEVKRDGFHKKIASCFQDNHAQNKLNIISLSGLAGSGKTTIAKDYLSNSHKKYNFKGWLNARSRELLDAQFISLGKKYQLFNDDEAIDEKRKKVLDFLSSKPSVLLIYDDVPSFHAIRDYIPQNADVLLTSKNAMLPKNIAVNKMTEKEALALLDFLTKNTPLKQDDFKELINALGHFPLALSQAGAYIQENKITPKQYLLLLEKHSNALLKDATMPPMESHEPVFNTIQLNLEQLKSTTQGKAAFELLKFLSICGSQSMPRSFLCHVMFGENSEDAQIKLNKLFHELKRLSLATINKVGVSMHELVQSVVKADLSLQEQKKLLMQATKAATNMKKKRQTHDEMTHLYPHLKHLVQVKKATSSSSTPSNLEFLLAKISYQFGLYPETQHLLEGFDINAIDSRELLAWTYRKRGKYKDANSILKQVKLAKIKSFGENSLEAASIYHAIGRNYLSLGHYAEAKVLLEKSLNIRKAQLPKTCEAIADTLGILGRAYMDLGDYKQANNLIEEALMIKKQLYGPRSIEVSLVHHALGRNFRKLGDYTLANNHLVKALTIKEKIYGKESLDAAYTLHAIGANFLSLGKLKEARTYLERSLAIKSKHLPKDNIVIAYTLHYLGRIYFELGFFPEAKNHLENALAIMQDHFGPNHVILTHTNHYVEHLYMHLGEFKQAKRLMECSLSIRENHYGKEHMYASFSKHNLGVYHFLRGDYASAEKLLRQALALKIKHFDENHVELVNTLIFQTWNFVHKNQLVEAKKNLEKVIPIVNTHYAPEHIYCLSALELDALITYLLGKKHKGLKKYMAYLKQTKNHYGKDHVFTQRAHLLLANLHGIASNARQCAEHINKTSTYIQKTQKDHPLLMGDYFMCLSFLAKMDGQKINRQKNANLAYAVFEKILPKGHKKVRYLTSLSASKNELTSMHALEPMTFILPLTF